MRDAARGSDAALRRTACALGVSLAALAGGACGQDPARTPSQGLDVVTTVSPITNLAQNVGGDRVLVRGLVPEGTNSHTFEPAPSDARALAEAEAVFVNGLHLEEPTLELAEANAGDGVPVVELAPLTITPEEYIFDFSFPESEGDPNPHLWTNPLHGKRYAEIIRDTLTELDPSNAAYYESNYDALATRLDQLDSLVRDVTETVPPQNRKLLTYHDSFPYFAREYGWQIVGAIQPSDFSDPSPREVAELIEQVRSERLPAIFGSEVFPSPVLEQIARETGARYVDALRDDDLPGSPGDPNHSYLGLMAFDFRTFMGALGGDVSPFDRLDVSNLAGEATAVYPE
jgi:ABC-type Zn uptake system ZnuABC Zn-binding protein ZnuA